MKSKLIISAILAMSVASQVTAITPQEATSAEYLINHGHSKDIAKMVELQTHQVNGIAPPKPEGSVILRWVRKIQAYYDPAYDDGNFGKHDTTMDVPSTPANL